MSTNTHILMRDHNMSSKITDLIVAVATQLHIDLNTVSVVLNRPLMVQIGEPKCGHCIFLMTGIYGDIVRVILTGTDGAFIRELGSFTAEQSDVQPKSDQ